MKREFLTQTIKRNKKKEKRIAAEAKCFLDQLDVRFERVKPQTFRILQNFNDIDLPVPGERMRIRTQRQLNLLAILVKILDVHGHIDCLSIATYTLNKESWEVLKDLLRAKRIVTLHLLLASSYEFRDKSYCETLKVECLTLARTYDIHLCFAWIHWKITLAQCGDNFYQLEGSMNYSTNNMAEQILFENSQESYEHDFELLQRLKQQKLKSLELVC